jgi:hypothetical protein
VPSRVKEVKEASSVIKSRRKEDLSVKTRLDFLLYCKKWQDEEGVVKGASWGSIKSGEEQGRYLGVFDRPTPANKGSYEAHLADSGHGMGGCRQFDRYLFFANGSRVPIETVDVPPGLDLK